MEANPRTFDSVSALHANSGRTEEGAWSYAVPPQSEITPGSELDDPYDLTDRSSIRRVPGAPPHTRQRLSLRPKNSLEAARLKQNSTSRGLKPPVNEQDGASSGDDSLLDLYRSSNSSPNIPNGPANMISNTQGAARKRVTSRERSKIRRKSSRGGTSIADGTVHEDSDPESKWIHRDKLAQIESREMAEMGIRLNRPSRANSHAKSAKTAKSNLDVQESNQEELFDEDPVTKESRKLQQVVDDDMQQQRIRGDADAFASHVSQRSEERAIPTRPGTSRIPVPASTSASYEEDSPLEMRHKRSESFGFQKQRARSQSGGSQYILDSTQERTNGVNGTSIQGSPQGSPQKDRAVSKGSSSNRKPSEQRKLSSTQTRSRGNSNTDSPKRPNTSGGSRPPTARPEGEAPWIATMYKPDPRLPPDQQMLPTHAKRIAQLQAEAEAKAVRGAEKPGFHLLDSDESNGGGRPDGTQEEGQFESDKVADMPNSNGSAANRTSMQEKRSSVQQKRSSIQNQGEGGQWPLRTPSGHEVTTGGKRASPSNGVEHGGYNLMPPISSTQSDQEKRQSLQKRSSQRSYNTFGNSTEQERRENAALAPVNQPVRLLPDRNETSQPKKKGCGCCVVM